MEKEPGLTSTSSLLYLRIRKNILDSLHSFREEKRAEKELGVGRRINKKKYHASYDGEIYSCTNPKCENHISPDGGNCNKIIVDKQHGCVVCTTCGLVLLDMLLEHNPYESNTSSAISTAESHILDKMTGEKQIGRTRKFYKTKLFQNACEEIDRISDDEHVSERAKFLFRCFSDSREEVKHFKDVILCCIDLGKTLSIWGIQAPLQFSCSLCGESFNTRKCLRLHACKQQLFIENKFDSRLNDEYTRKTAMISTITPAAAAAATTTTTDEDILHLQKRIKETLTYKEDTITQAKSKEEKKQLKKKKRFQWDD